MIDAEYPDDNDPGPLMVNKRTSAGSGAPDADQEQRLLLKFERPITPEEFQDGLIFVERGQVDWTINCVASGTNINWWCEESAYFITEDFDPATVTWNTKPDTDASASDDTAYIDGLSAPSLGDLASENISVGFTKSGSPSRLQPTSFEFGPAAAPASTIYGVEIRATEIGANNSFLTDILVAAPLWTVAASIERGGIHVG